MESVRRLRQDIERLQELLRRSDGPTTPGNGCTRIRERIRVHDTAESSNLTASLSKTDKILRKFDERPLSRANALPISR